MSSATLPCLSDLPIAGEAPFRRLSMRHRRVVALHLAGYSGVQIDTALGCSSGYAGSVLRNPRTKPLLDAAYAEYERELIALFPKGIETIRRHLDNVDGQIALRAVDLLFKATGRYRGIEDAPQTTAEDVIERILERILPDGTKQTLSLRRVVKSVVRGSGDDLSKDEEVDGTGSEPNANLTRLEGVSPPIPSYEPETGNGGTPSLSHCGTPLLAAPAVDHSVGEADVGR